MLALAVALVAATVASSASAALFFLFKLRLVEPGALVTVRLGGPPASFTLDQRKRPFEQPIRLYLVPNRVARTVRRRLDPRLHFIGSLVPDRNGHGVLTFTVPPLDTDRYAIAAWCPSCTRHSFGHPLFVPPVSHFTSSLFPGFVLRLTLPPATDTCPVTRGGNYSNGLLSTTIPSGGVLVAQKDRGLFQKLGWLPREDFSGVLAVRGERLDAPGRMQVLAVNWGHSYPSGRGSWRSAVTFPSEGCWRISGRVGDITLTYVVKVVAG